MSRKGTILIVDDEPGVREVLEEYLAAHGYAAVGAESAAAARKLVAKEPVDLALIDIHMPGEDGLTLARHLRERHPGIAIVMLTSATAVVDRIVGLEMGADDYVPKPFDPRELLRVAARSATRACAWGVACSTCSRTGSSTTRATRCRCRRSSSTC